LKKYNLKYLKEKKFVDILKDIYGLKEQEHKERYINLSKKFIKNFKKNEFFLFSSPGRTEICGNHTDHNNGKVLAAAVNLDMIAAVSKRKDNKIIIISEGYKKPFEIDITHLKIIEEEKGSTSSIIRGINSRFSELGYNIGGFNAYVSSSIPTGSGLSSSASFEVMIGVILSTLSNKNNISRKEIAQIGQYAENNFFMKPCGLMDQIACAYGGVVSIDFKQSDYPEIEKLDVNLKTKGYSLVIVDTGGSHADLTDHYSSIKKEMKTVAEFFGKNVCRDIELNDIYSNMDLLRKNCGDRAVLRAIHYLLENQRVDNIVRALKRGDFSGFIDLINKSGNSSCCLLQNCYSPKSVKNQGIMIALSITKEFLEQVEGQSACRVHGGGFEGTIQVFLPHMYREKYIRLINELLKNECAIEPGFRRYGAICLNEFS